MLGANDGIVSTASLVVGIAAASPTHDAVITAGVAGLVAGAMSMAAGEYVSVRSQADTENADLARERRELASDDVAEHVELTNIYIVRGLDENLARQVADQLMARDALGAHARDELGIVASQRARPVVAALTSAGTFALGAALLRKSLDGDHRTGPSRSPKPVHRDRWFGQSGRDHLNWSEAGIRLGAM